MTVTQAAKELGLTDGALYNWRHQEKMGGAPPLRSRQRGNLVYYLKTDVLREKARRETQAKVGRPRGGAAHP